MAMSARPNADFPQHTPIPVQSRPFGNGHLTGPTHPARLYAHPSEAPSSGRREHRRLRKEKAALALPSEGKLKFADRLRALLKRESHLSGQLPGGLPQDPYAFSEAPAAPPAGGAVPKASPVAAAPPPPEPHRALENGAAGSEFFPNHRPHPQLQAQAPAAAAACSAACSATCSATGPFARPAARAAVCLSQDVWLG
ncbi:hypothetical protein HPB47_012081 [Ixodes persulcatus]|uniref:Uncharacterized protein n=1 Tax=Ixodes persulcatus TaxID=34615 RepID=A0AC60NUT6_IXOPE|nr:hypothetical protein HPB47_012081 [Ixodes persulcatus]